MKSYIFGAFLGGATFVAVLGMMGWLQQSSESEGDTQEVAVDTQALAGVEVEFYRSPSCGCCAGHAAALEDAGATVTMNNVNEVELQNIKGEHGITMEKQSCHTAMIDDYVVEGHVPIQALEKLVSEQPETEGIVLPGMPIGTPGMPGEQTQPFIVETLEGEVFWRKEV